MKVKLTITAMLCLLLSNVFGASFSGRDSDGDTEIQRATMRVLDEYMTAWNAKDLVAWEKTFHFPHYRLASGQMRVLEHAGMQDATKVWAQIDGWHHSAWDHRRIVHSSNDKVHVDTRFTRYRADGSKIGTYDSLYVITKENGRWGVKLRSSFAQ